MLPEISEEEKPFELPEGWEWVRLGEIVEVLDYMRKPISKDERTQGIYPYYGASGIVDHVSDYIFDDKLVLVGEDGAKWGKGDKTAFCISGKSWVNNHVHVLKLFNSIITNEFLVNYLTISDLAHFITGTTVPKLNQAKLISIPVIISPIKTQININAKIEQLMSLCDQLEQHSLTSLDAHQQLVETLLTTLTDSQNADELAENWSRISEHFDTLFTTEASIDALKQTILQLAVMGKLVPQDPNDEPASELLKRIAQEKAQLVKDGKIKKQKPLPPISDEEKPFELPDGWVWSRLDHVATKITDGDHKTPPRIAEGYKLLSAKNIRDGFLDYENCDYISESSYIKSRERCLPEKGDLLIVSVGGTIGRSSLITGDSEFALVRSVAIIKPLIIEPNFLKIAMDSQLLQSMIHSHKRGGAQPCLYLGEISKFLFPVPPLKEQKRIVNTVNIFMEILETLTLAFKSAQQTQLHLADALTDAAIN